MAGYDEMPRIVAAATPDIRNHLWTFYWVARMLRARTIVELGVRGGDSTRAWLAAAYDLGAKVVSFDVEEATRTGAEAMTRQYGLPWHGEHWDFRWKDSVAGGAAWIGSLVDIVFVDTDHTQETTRREIAAWAPHVRPGGAMLFHDYGLPADHADDHRDGVKPAVDGFVASWTQSRSWRLEAYPCSRIEGDAGLAILWRLSDG